MKSKLSPSWISVAALLIIWQLTASGIGHPAMFPSVTQLFGELFLLLSTGSFYHSFFSTILRGIEGFLFASLLALPASVLALHYPFWKSFFHPIVVILRSIPVIAVVLVALIFLLPSNLPVIIGGITMLPILYQNFLSGWEHTDKKVVEMAKFYNKTLYQRFRYVYFLQAKDLLFAGLATAVGFGWRAVIIGEVLSSPASGIGTSMKRAQAYIDMSGLLAWTIVAIAGGFMLELILKKVAGMRYIPTLWVREEKTNNQALTIERTIDISNLSFHRASTPIIHHLSLKINNSSIILLKSPSGSGKSTLLYLLATLLQPTEGSVVTNGINVRSFSFQDKRLIPGLTIEQNIAFITPLFPALTSAQHHRLDQLLNVMELPTMRERFPHELSGGEQQRVALARALMIQSDLLLLDEPLTGIGTELKNNIIRFIEQDSTTNRPLIVWATHENPEEVLNCQTLIIQQL